MKEIFKDVKGYEGLYQVSNLGRVKSLPKKHRFKKNGMTVEKILNPKTGSNGYYTVTLCKNGIQQKKLVHRIVLEFPSGQVDHINRNKTDNRIENLRIADRSLNSYNSDLQKNNKTGFRGISFDNARQKFTTSIKINYQTKEQKRFSNLSDAIKHYNYLAMKYYGKNAILNQMPCT